MRVGFWLSCFLFLLLAFASNPLFQKVRKKTLAFWDARDLNIASLPKECVKKHSFVVVIPSYNNALYAKQNLESVLFQNYTNFRIIYINDASIDGTGEIAKEILAKSSVPVEYIENEKNKGALANIYSAVFTCKNEEIVVVLDGDDFFAHFDVLARLNHYYQHPDVWMAYSQHLETKGSKLGISRPVSRRLLKAGKSREIYPFVFSHLRSFYAGLFKKIPLDRLLHHGRFFDVACDCAIFFPMLDLAREHAFYLPEVLCHYNNENPIADRKIHLFAQQEVAELLRYQKALLPLLENPSESKELAEETFCFDQLIFSQDRPLHLSTRLESHKKIVSGKGNVSVIYTASTPKIEEAYEQLAVKFSDVCFYRWEGQSFKALFEKAIGSFPSKHAFIAFGRDHSVFYRQADLAHALKAVVKRGAKALFLQLGSDQGKATPLIDIEGGSLCAWQFNGANAEFANGNNFAMTIYRKSELTPFVYKSEYESWEHLETLFSEKCKGREVGFCFPVSPLLEIDLEIPFEQELCFIQKGYVADVSREGKIEWLQRL